MRPLFIVHTECLMGVKTFERRRCKYRESAKIITETLYTLLSTLVAPETPYALNNCFMNVTVRDYERTSL